MVFIIVVLVFTFMLKQPSGIRVLLHDAKTEDYNTLIIGESHGESGYNPFIISEELKCNAVNISRRKIPIIFLYYMIAEANTDKKIKTIILDIDPQYWIVTSNHTPGEDMNLFPYLSGTKKWRFFAEYFKEAIWPNTFSLLFADYMLTEESVKRIPLALKAKTNIDYIRNNDKAMEAVNEFLGTNKVFNYCGRGYYYGVNYVENGNQSWQYDNDIQSKNIEILDRIVNYCNENEINLICTQSALSPSLLHRVRIGNIHDDFSTLLQERGIDFYDFNYAKKEYLDRTDADYVDLEEHMMGELSSRQTKLLSEIMKSDNKDVFFYRNVDEVLDNYTN